MQKRGNAMEANDDKLPVWYWILTALLVLWALMGVWVYYDFVTSTPEKMAKYVADGAYSREYADSLLNTPAWSTGVFAIAVFSGFLGAIGLVLRRSWAAALYGVSMLFVAISIFNMFAVEKLHTMMSGDQIGMEAVVFGLGVLGVWFSRHAKAKGWLK